MVRLTGGWRLAVPFISLFFAIKSYSVAKSGRRNSWDERPGHVITQRPIGQFRIVVGIGVYVVLFVGVMALGALGD